MKEKKNENADGEKLKERAINAPAFERAVKTGEREGPSATMRPRRAPE